MQMDSIVYAVKVGNFLYKDNLTFDQADAIRFRLMGSVTRLEVIARKADWS